MVTLPNRGRSAAYARRERGDVKPPTLRLISANFMKRGAGIIPREGFRMPCAAKLRAHHPTTLGRRQQGERCHPWRRSRQRETASPAARLLGSSAATPHSPPPIGRPSTSRRKFLHAGCTEDRRIK